MNAKLLQVPFLRALLSLSFFHTPSSAFSSLSFHHAKTPLSYSSKVLITTSQLEYSKIGSPNQNRLVARKANIEDIISLSSSSSSLKSKSESILEEEEEDIVQRLGLGNQFDRWIFLQKTLEGEIQPPHDVNVLLFRVLKSWLDYPPSNEKRGTTTVSLTDEKMEVLTKLIHHYSFMNSIPLLPNVVTDDSSEEDVPLSVDSLSLHQDLNFLLPDEDEDEDAYNSLWDLVKELYGEGSVAFQQKKSDEIRYRSQSECVDEESVELILFTEWDRYAMAVRLLLYYDFLSVGVLEPSFS